MFTSILWHFELLFQPATPLSKDTKPRVRHNSEALLNELAALHDQQALPVVDVSQFDEAFAAENVGDADFSLLGEYFIYRFN